jgi:hypothetical protein
LERFHRRFNIGEYDAIDTTEPRVAQQLCWQHALAPDGLVEGFDRNVETEFVTEAKAVDYGLGKIVDSDINTVDLDYVDSLGQRWS